MQCFEHAWGITGCIAQPRLKHMIETNSVPKRSLCAVTSRASHKAQALSH